MRHAKKGLRSLKGIMRLQAIIDVQAMKSQVSNTLIRWENYLDGIT